LIAEINARLKARLTQLAPGQNAVCIAYPLGNSVRVELYMASDSKEISAQMSVYARELMRDAALGKLRPEEEGANHSTEPLSPKLSGSS
jgi:hypothetical protein